MESEASTWNRKCIKAQKREFFKKLRSRYVLEAYIHIYIYIINFIKFMKKYMIQNKYKLFIHL